MTAIIIMFSILVTLIVVGTALIVIGTIKKNQWGINLKQMYCPNCNIALPRIRTPKNTRQTMWGGHTCQECGTEVDKWGRIIES